MSPPQLLGPEIQTVHTFQTNKIKYLSINNEGFTENHFNSSKQPFTRNRIKQLYSKVISLELIPLTEWTKSLKKKEILKLSTYKRYLYSLKENWKINIFCYSWHQLNESSCQPLSYSLSFHQVSGWWTHSKLSKLSECLGQKQPNVSVMSKSWTLDLMTSSLAH